MRNVASALCDSLSAGFLHHGSEGGEIFAFLPSAASAAARLSEAPVRSGRLSSLRSSLKASFVCLETVKLRNYLYKRSPMQQTLVSPLKDCRT